MQKDTRFGGMKHINCGFLSEETWRIIKLWCSHEKGGQIFFPPVCMGYTHTAIALPEHFLCTWRIKLPGQAFVLTEEL